MNRLLLLSVLGIICLVQMACTKNNPPNNSPTTSDSFTVTVSNGYGSGKYKVGDTVHIFSAHYADNQLFDKWTGSDAALLNGSDEWHTWFVMPNRNVAFSGSIKNSTPFSLTFANIMGRDRLKPVYYYFPNGCKGIAYILHGTNGSAANIVAGYEWMQLIKQLVTDGYGVIITEAEESTTGVDINADGKLRWQLVPVDTTQNVDYANIRIITNTLYQQGIAPTGKPKFSMGMSNGGFFSAALAYLYQYKASVQYCAQGPTNLMGTTNIPTLFCMASQDQNPSIGAAGNAAALTYSNDMNSRNVYSEYYANPRSPLYPQRFARNGVLSEAQSEEVFNELKAKGFIDNKNYYIGFSNTFVQDYLAHQADYPAINSPDAFNAVLEQINIAVADHHIYSDAGSKMIAFMNK